MKKIVVATKNKHKIIEFEAALNPLGYEIESLYDYEELPEIIEDKDTFAGNAKKKAQTLSEYLNKTVIADDSGLEVEAIHGAPGVYSARYAGENVTYDDNNKLLLKNMKSETNRNARFVTNMCIYYPDGTTLHFEEYLYGEIAHEYKGENGFGYDPIFIVKDDHRHLAEYTLEEKNKVSHRGKCLQKLVDYLAE